MFNIVKTPKEGKCPARRCPDTPWAPPADRADLADANPHDLCSRHMAEWLGAGKPELQLPAPAPAAGKPTKAAAPDQSDALAAQVETEREAARAYLAACQSYTIETQSDVDKLAAVMGQLKHKRNSLEAQRKGVADPIYASWKKVNALFKPVVEYYDSCEKALKQRLAAFKAAQDAAQDAALAVVATQPAAPSEVLAVAHGVENVAMPSTVSTTKKWVVESIDVEKLPRKYMVPDMSRIATVVKAWGPKHGIDGVTVRQEIGVINRG